jgi:hypothetical protein
MLNSKSKRGAANMDMIIWLAIGVVVLLVVVVAFTGGFNKAWNKLVGFGGDGDSLETIGQQCKLAVDTDSTNSYCSTIRTYKEGEKTIKGTCNVLKLKHKISLSGTMPNCPTGVPTACMVTAANDDDNCDGIANAATPALATPCTDGTDIGTWKASGTTCPNGQISITTSSPNSLVCCKT